MSTNSSQWSVMRLCLCQCRARMKFSYMVKFQLCSSELSTYLIMIQCIMLERFRFCSCIYPRCKQIKSLLKYFHGIRTNVFYKNRKNDITICKNFESFAWIWKFNVVLSNADINDQPIPFLILIYTFSKCPNVNKMEYLISDIWSIYSLRYLHSNRRSTVHEESRLCIIPLIWLIKSRDLLFLLRFLLLFLLLLLFFFSFFSFLSTDHELVHCRSQELLDRISWNLVEL